MMMLNSGIYVIHLSPLLVADNAATSSLLTISNTAAVWTGVPNSIRQNGSQQMTLKNAIISFCIYMNPMQMVVEIFESQVSEIYICNQVRSRYCLHVDVFSYYDKCISNLLPSVISNLSKRKLHFLWLMDFALSQVCCLVPSTVHTVIAVIILLLLFSGLINR